VVIANASGIYGLYSYREVFEFKEFWGIGSGRSFALGAMHAAYAKAKTAKEVAEAGIAAGLRVRPQLGPMPCDIFTLKRKKNNEHPDGSEGPRHRGLRGSGRDRGAGEAGDTVKVEQSLVTVESDKASMEIPSTHAGVVKEAEGQGRGQGQARVGAADDRGGGSAAAPHPSRCARAELPAPAPKALRPHRHQLPACRLLPPARRRPRVRRARARRRPRRLFRRLPRRRPRHEDRAVERYATLGGVCLNVGCIPVQGAAARGRRDGRSEPLRPLGISFGKPTIDRAKLKAHKNKVVGKLTGGLAAMAKMRKVTTVRGIGNFIDPYHLEVQETTGTADDHGQEADDPLQERHHRGRLAGGAACPSCPRTIRASWIPPARWKWPPTPSAC
jgi:hypothetical protein